MDRLVEIWTEVLPPAWRWSPEDYLGGTHEFIVNTAKHCRNEVIVYYDGLAGLYDGIYYLPRSQYKGSDVVLACNSKPPKLGKYNIVWCDW
jgi:hypothetical protein